MDRKQLFIWGWPNPPPYIKPTGAIAKCQNQLEPFLIIWLHQGHKHTAHFIWRELVLWLWILLFSGPHKKGRRRFSAWGEASYSWGIHPSGDLVRLSCPGLRTQYYNFCPHTPGNTTLMCLVLTSAILSLKYLISPVFYIVWAAQVIWLQLWVTLSLSIVLHDT